MLWQQERPNTAACITKLENDIEHSFPGIANTIEIINELPNGSPSALGIPFLEQVNIIPFMAFEWMQGRIIYKYFVPPGSQERSRIFCKLLKATVTVGYSPCP